MRCDVRARPRVSRRGPNRVKAPGVELRSSRARLARPSADIAAHTSAAFERVEAALVGRGCYIPARAAVDAVVHLVAGQDMVVARSAQDRAWVRRLFSCEPVKGFQEVVARPSVQPAKAREAVVARPALELVLAAAAVDLVGARPSGELVVALGSDEAVLARSAIDVELQAPRQVDLQSGADGLQLVVAITQTEDQRGDAARRASRCRVVRVRRAARSGRDLVAVANGDSPAKEPDLQEVLLADGGLIDHGRPASRHRPGLGRRRDGECGQSQSQHDCPASHGASPLDGESLSQRTRAGHRLLAVLPRAAGPACPVRSRATTVTVAVTVRGTARMRALRAFGPTVMNGVRPSDSRARTV